jgi:hypothetical protein
MLEAKPTTPNLPRGIVPLLETPFLENGSIDYDSLHKLVEHSILRSKAAASQLLRAVPRGCR